MTVTNFAKVCALALLFTTVASADVSWISGQSPPGSWTISPAVPSPSDIISFSGPTETYGNECVGRADLGGTPAITVNSITKVVQLYFQGPAPTICTLIWKPVAGLQGSFGPLAAGNWTFRCTQPDIAFEIPFVVGGGNTIYVDDDAPGFIHNGTSWSRAFLNLQDGLAAANAGDEIHVARGLYRPDTGGGMTPGDRHASFELKNDVKVLGGYAGALAINPNARDFDIHETFLSGDLNGDDLWGILNKDDNSYQVVRAAGVSSGTLLEGFTIAAGQADGDYPYHYGGGIYIETADPAIAHCKIEGNVAVFGGGIASIGGLPAIANCTLSGNRALVFGGGLYNHDSTTDLTNCLIVGNSAGSSDILGSAAIYNLGSSLGLYNCTVADNSAPQGMAIVNFTWGFPPSEKINIVNSILYNGGDEIYSNNPSVISVRYCDVQGSAAGPGNISTNPQFVDPGLWSIEGEWFNGDYRLKSISPCLNAGSNALLPMDILDLDTDGNTSESLPIDLDGEARIQGTRVDMGAYEGSSASPGPGPVVPGPDIYVGGIGGITLSPDPNSPDPIHNYIGCGTVEISLNFSALLTVEVIATSAAGGDWSGWIVPNPVGPGEDIPIQVCIKGENVDIGALPPGPGVQVAEVTLYAQPAP